MGHLRWLLPSLLGVAMLGAGAADAGAVTPVVFGVNEAVASDDGGRILVVYGASINKYSAYELQTDGAVSIAPLTILLKTKNMVALKLPADLARPAYTLPGNYLLKFTLGKTSGTWPVRITMGYPEADTVTASALSNLLRVDLDDAATLGGETVSQVHEWGRLTGVPGGFADGVDNEGSYTAGTGLSLTGSAFSLTYGGASGDFGAATTAARSDHLHDGRYFTKVQLSLGGGTVNDAGNPVDWSRIKGMPAGFADGIDDGGSGGSYTAGAGLTLTGTTFSVNFAGTGNATTASKSDHNHDASYYLQTQLNATGGTINSAGNPVDWTRLKSVPAGFADGTDADTTYSAGSGLLLSTTTFSLNWGGTGSATTASRSDHNHGTTYLALTGGTLSGALTISNTSGQAIIATSGSTSTTAGGIDCVTSGGVGVAGHGDIGVLGDLDSDGKWGVAGFCAYSYQVGVYAYANSGVSDTSSTALYAYHFWYGPGIKGKSFGGVGVYGYAVYGKSSIGVAAANRGYGIALYANKPSSSYGDALVVNHSGYGGNLAVFKTYGSNYARISRKGTGYFNGGTYNYGADFAESVKVDRPAATFEPGDVMVIDPKAPRQFALSTSAESTLVAGVVSTRPAVVATTHRVALEGTAWKREEVKLGIVGIVPTKVCDEGGPVGIGDLLVTSSIPGHAKKAPANPAVGTVIGKALGSLDRGRGKIEVLLMAR